MEQENTDLQYNNVAVTGVQHDEIITGVQHGHQQENGDNEQENIQENIEHMGYDDENI